MKFAIMGPSPEFAGNTTRRLLEEARKQFRKVEYVPVKEVVLTGGKKASAKYGKKSLEDYDYILPRIDSKRAEIGYPIMRFLDEAGVSKPYPAMTILVASVPPDDPAT